jgi:hypothetical protein
MAATFKDLNAIASDTTFQGRCLYAANVAIMGVMAESITVKDHAARADFARQVIAGQIPGARIAMAVLTISTVAALANVANISTDAGISDANLQAAVNSILPSLAGIANTP